MHEITLSIPCETYLADWYRNHTGGLNPIRLRKNSPESHLLHILLQNKNRPNSANTSAGPRPEAAGGKEAARGPGIEKGRIEIYIPYYRGMPPETYNHLSQKGQSALLSLLRKRFDLQLFQDLIPILQFTERRDELIWAWIETNNITPTETNYLAIEKRLQRMLNRLRTRQRVANYRKRKNKLK